jgi:hypothetical protein
MLRVFWRMSISGVQGGRSHIFAPVAKHTCITENMVRVFVIFLLLLVACHEFMFYRY